MNKIPPTRRASGVSEFNGKEKQTKNCAVCSSLFSGEVIVGDYNKSNSAVHPSHTPLHLPLTLQHQDGSRHATLWALAFITLRDVCPQDGR